MFLETSFHAWDSSVASRAKTGTLDSQSQWQGGTGVDNEKTASQNHPLPELDGDPTPSEVDPYHTSLPSYLQWWGTQHFLCPESFITGLLLVHICFCAQQPSEITRCQLKTPIFSTNIILILLTCAERAGSALTSFPKPNLYQCSLNKLSWQLHQSHPILPPGSLLWMRWCFVHPSIIAELQFFSLRDKIIKKQTLEQIHLCPFPSPEQHKAWHRVAAHRTSAKRMSLFPKRVKVSRWDVLSKTVY